MANVNQAQILAMLSKLNGQVSIENGVATLPDGTSVDLAAAAQANPRVLISCSGGVSTYNRDEGVEVVEFDWDNYQEDQSGGIPVHFADLAVGLRMPIEGFPGRVS